MILFQSPKNCQTSFRCFSNFGQTTPIISKKKQVFQKSKKKFGIASSLKMIMIRFEFLEKKNNLMLFFFIIPDGKMILNTMLKELFRHLKIPMLLEKWEKLSNLTTLSLKSNLLLIRAGKTMHSTNMLAMSFLCIGLFQILETPGKCVVAPLLKNVRYLKENRTV